MVRTKAPPVKLTGTEIAGTDGVKEKRKHHWRPGTVALREIKRYQKTTKLVLPRTKVVNLIREIAGVGGKSIRFKRSALDALHEAVEKEMVSMFQRAMLVTVNGDGTTLKLKDLKTANAVVAIV